MGLVSDEDAILGSYTFVVYLALPCRFGWAEVQRAMSGNQSFDDHGMTWLHGQHKPRVCRVSHQKASYLNHRFTRWKRQRHRDDESLGSSCCSSVAR